MGSTTYGGDSEFYKEFNLTSFGGCYHETDEGDVPLTGQGFHLYGPNVGSPLPLQNVAGIAYEDGSVTVENVRKTDHDDLSITKYNDHVHYRVDLSACTFDGGAHRYIRIKVHGSKFDPKDIGVIGDRRLLIERSNANGTFTVLSSLLDPGFAYWASLPDSKLFAGNYRGVGIDLLVVTANGLAYSQANNLDGSFRTFALGSRYLPNFIPTALGRDVKFVVGDFLGTGRDCILAYGGIDRTAVLAIPRTDGTFEDKIIALDPGFAYLSSLAESNILPGKFH